MNYFSIKFLRNYSRVFGVIGTALIFYAGFLTFKNDELALMIMAAGIGSWLCVLLYGGFVREYVAKNIFSYTIFLEKRIDARKLAARSPEKVQIDHGRHKAMETLYWQAMKNYPQPPNLIKWLSKQENNVWHQFLMDWNYDGPHDEALAWILDHPHCDRGTIQFFLSRNFLDANEYGSGEDRNTQEFFEICRRACERLIEDDFMSSKYYPHGWSSLEYDREVEVTRTHYERRIEENKVNYLPFDPGFFEVSGNEFAISEFGFQNYHVGVRFDVWLKSQGISADDPIFSREFRHWKDPMTRYYFS